MTNDVKEFINFKERIPITQKFTPTEEEMKRMLADSASELKRDNIIVHGFGMDDLSTTSIRQFRQLFTSSNPSHPWLALEDLELLRKIGAYRLDRQTEEEGITLAGLLMFGKDESLREQEVIPNYFPDFREKLSNDKNIRWTDRVYPDGTWDGNLLQFYLRVWPKLIATLPKPFQLNDDERIDETSTHIALREAFVNTLVHTDYSLSGNIVVELVSDRFSFSNPGALLVSLHQYYSGGISECRNPSLQLMFMLIGRAEKVGSGVDKIMSGWKHALWRLPFVELYSQPDIVKLIMPMFSVIPDNVLQELKDKFGTVDQLTPEELTVLSFALIEGSISNQRLQFAINIHSADISLMLRKLCDNNYLESDNKGRWTTYKLSSKLSTFDNKVDSSVYAAHNQEDKSFKVDTSASKVDTSIPKRLKKEELEELIMFLCKDKHIKMDEVASKTGRSIDYLKNKIFPAMIRDGKLVRKYPHTHNHPEQAYKTSSK